VLHIIKLYLCLIPRRTTRGKSIYNDRFPVDKIDCIYDVIIGTYTVFNPCTQWPDVRCAAGRYTIYITGHIIGRGECVSIWWRRV